MTSLPYAIRSVIGNAVVWRRNKAVQPDTQTWASETQEVESPYWVLRTQCGFGETSGLVFRENESGHITRLETARTVNEQAKKLTV